MVKRVNSFSPINKGKFVLTMDTWVRVNSFSPIKKYKLVLVSHSLLWFL